MSSPPSTPRVSSASVGSSAAPGVQAAARSAADTAGESPVPPNFSLPGSIPGSGPRGEPGKLVSLVVTDPAERERLRQSARGLPAVRLTPRQLCDLELLATGAFSPLCGFMGRADYESVSRDMRLADGTLWPIPVVLRLADAEKNESAQPVEPGDDLALVDPAGSVLAVLSVTEHYDADPRREAREVYGSADPAHPLVAELLGGPRRAITGVLRVIDLPHHADYRHLRLTPAETRARLAAEHGGRPVVAFQTRNPMHRAHEELVRRAVERAGAAGNEAALLLHPVVGLTKPGDVDHFTRVRVYEALWRNRRLPEHTVLALLPLAMRLAGPRSALWHAIIRKNYGATHFIVGRDHASPGLDTNGEPFYGPYDAQEALAKHADEIGVTMVPFEAVAYRRDTRRYEPVSAIPAGVETLSISGTQIRTDYLAPGKPLPEWFTRPEVARILAEAYPPRTRQGVLVWFTGLSGSGKSTIAERLVARLMERGRRVTLLDGDVVRTHLSKGLGFSKPDRDTNIRRIGFVAAEVVAHGGIAVAAAISPYRAVRAEVRRGVGAGQFIEVFVNTSLEVCEARDVKGLYAKARVGELRGFTGIDDPYEAPEAPELALSGAEGDPDDAAARIVAELEARGFLTATQATVKQRQESP